MSIVDPGGGGVVSGGVIVDPGGGSPGGSSSPSLPSISGSPGPADIQRQVPAPSRTYLVPALGFFQSNEFTIHDGETLDFIAAFSRYFTQTDPADSIADVDVSIVSGSGFTLGSEDHSDGLNSIQFITTSGATPGTVAEILFHVTTAVGRIKDVRIFIEVLDWDREIVPALLDPTGVADIDFYFNEWFSSTANGDTRASSVIEADAFTEESPAQLGTDSSLKSHPDATTVKQFVYAGTNGTQYWVICTLTTAAGRVVREAQPVQVLNKAA
jgi:hypothetical protein